MTYELILYAASCAAYSIKWYIESQHGLFTVATRTNFYKQARVHHEVSNCPKLIKMTQTSSSAAPSINHVLVVFLTS